MRYRFAIFVAAALTTAAIASADDFRPVRATAEQEAAAASWIAAHAQPVEPSGPTQADLAPIVAKLAGARIVGIGEATHGTHEDQAFKAELIRALVRSGQVRLLLLEGNLAPNRRLDDYVRRGVGDPADALRDVSQFRNMKGDEFTALVLWLRAWNLSHPDDMVAIAGFDLQDAGRDADHALDYVARRDAKTAARLRKAFAYFRPAQPGYPYPKFPRMMSEASPAERAGYLALGNELEAWFARSEAKLGSDPAFADARDAAIAARQGFWTYEHGISAPPDIDRTEYFSRRDRAMADNILRLQARSGAGGALWAHNYHVVDRFAPALALGFRSLGIEIEDRLGEGYRAVGFTFSRGTLLTTPAAKGVPMDKIAVDDKVMPLANDGADTLGGLLARALPDRQAAWIDMAAMRAEPALKAFGAASYLVGGAGWYVVPEEFPGDYDAESYPWIDSYDILVWHRAVTPQRRWPDLPSAPKTNGS